MAFGSKDGKRQFSMPSRKMAYDRGHGEQQAKPQSAVLEAPGGEDQPMGDEQDGAQIAEQHGPASHIDMEHPPEEQGMHHVHSMHPDGHEHHSDHGSKEEAHEHAKKLAGMSMEEHEPDEGGMDQGGEEY
jgi:hypothetical protein